MKQLIAILSCTVVSLSIASAEWILREWTNTEGRTIQAELQKVEDDQATLRLDNGRVYTIDLATLSQADQDYVRGWLAEQASSAQAAEMGLEHSVLGELIVETAFDNETPPTRKTEIDGWKAGIGEWRVEGGVLIGDEVPEDDHASSLTYRFEAEHLIIRAQVRLGTAEQIAIACRDNVAPNLHLGRLYITPDKLWIQKMEGISTTTSAERLIVEDVDLDRDEWYPVTIEIIGETYRATVGDHVLEATHPRFADGKAILALVNRGQGAEFKNVGIWHAELAPQSE